MEPMKQPNNTARTVNWRSLARWTERYHSSSETAPEATGLAMRHATLGTGPESTTGQPRPSRLFAPPMTAATSPGAEPTVPPFDPVPLLAAELSLPRAGVAATV